MSKNHPVKIHEVDLNVQTAVETITHKIITQIDNSIDDFVCQSVNAELNATEYKVNVQRIARAIKDKEYYQWHCHDLPKKLSEKGCISEDVLIMDTEGRCMVGWYDYWHEGGIWSSFDTRFNPQKFFCWKYIEK